MDLQLLLHAEYVTDMNILKSIQIFEESNISQPSVAISLILRN
jgi:hypothetical protein